MKELAVRAWRNHCMLNHGVVCDQALAYVWGIKYQELLFASRLVLFFNTYQFYIHYLEMFCSDDALRHTDLLGLYTIHLFGSTERAEVEEFVGL